jgi:hypothetical protein
MKLITRSHYKDLEVRCNTTIRLTPNWMTQIKHKLLVTEKTIYLEGKEPRETSGDSIP